MRREYWHLTEGLIFAYFAVFILASGFSEGLAALALVPGQVAARPWSLLTYGFIPNQSMFWFFISMLVLWIMARPLEDAWGSPRFLAFWLVATLGAAGASLLLGQPLVGDFAFQASVLFTFATLYPDTEFRLFFIIPVKVKYLAIIGGAFLVFSGLAYGVIGGLAHIAGMSAGYLFFLATRRLPSRRKVVFEIKKKRSEMIVATQAATVEKRNSEWDPSVRAAETRAREAGKVVENDLPLLETLNAARDPDITVCAPGDFGYTEDEVCRSCSGYAECAARRIRIAGGAEADADGKSARQRSR